MFVEDKISSTNKTKNDAPFIQNMLAMIYLQELRNKNLIYITFAVETPFKIKY